KKVFILENANPVNLSAGTGNPIEIMDLGLGLQACCAARLADMNNKLDCAVQAVPKDIDEFVSYKMLGA
ncbi:MAG: hypothetical protein J5800_08700, partial [Spirochaetales bacterium]|nr:hypothetical protein [Spirochaetales bacterium]